jgi:RNA polymerase sigma factor (sigma-70 family)
MDHQDGSVLVEVMAAISLGDRAALAALYRHTSAKLFGVCLRILKDAREAEEVLQDVYVAVWHRAGTFDPARGSVIAWLVAIARNRALDRLRAVRHRRSERPLDDAHADLADGQPSALSRIEEHEAASALHRCLEGLEEPQRGAIRTAFLDGVTYEDLACRQGVPLGTMKSWIRRGLIRLRGCLES